MYKATFFRVTLRALLSLLVLVSLSSIHCSVAQEAVTKAVKGAATKGSGESVEYTSDRGGYSITCPPGWEKKGGIPGPIDMMFSCREDPSVISVTWAPMEKGQLGLSKSVVSEMKETIRSTYPGCEITAEEWREVDGAKAFCLSLRFKPLGMELRNKQVMLVKGGRFFTLVYTTSPEQFMNHLAEFEATVASFRASE